MHTYQYQIISSHSAKKRERKKAHIKLLHGTIAEWKSTQRRTFDKKPFMDSWLSFSVVSILCHWLIWLFDVVLSTCTIYMCNKIYSFLKRNIFHWFWMSARLDDPIPCIYYIRSRQLTHNHTRPYRWIGIWRVVATFFCSLIFSLSLPIGSNAPYTQVSFRS